MKALKLEDNNIIDIDIDNTLEAFQTAVDGHIETVGIVPGAVVMVVNEEGLLRGMAQNNIASLVARRYIVGPALIVGQYYNRNKGGKSRWKEMNILKRPASKAGYRRQ